MVKKRITLKKVIKQLARCKIKGRQPKYDYYCYDNHKYYKINNFDLLQDRFKCTGNCWQFFDCKDENIRLYYEKKEEEIKLSTGESI